MIAKNADESAKAVASDMTMFAEPEDKAKLYLPRMQRDIEQLRGLLAMQKNDADDKSQAIVDFQNEYLAKIIRHLNP